MTLRKTGLIVCAGLLAVLLPASFSLVRAWFNDPQTQETESTLSQPFTPAVPMEDVETGTHWASYRDFPTLQKLGYGFVITTVHPKDKQEWTETFDAAQSSGLKLIVGLYPEPYSLVDGKWQISPEGESFLRYAASRASLVKAIFVYNEPLWVNPLTKKNDYCGALSASELRALRTAIRGVWPDAKVYHDLGRPSEYAPGGAQPRSFPCVGDRYADTKGVTDFAGIWFYPFDASGYRKSYALGELRREITYVQTQMQALPIVLAQSFKCDHCRPAYRFPSPEELKDWNCATRALGPYAISWYPWRQSSYDDDLDKHPEAWSMSGPGACRSTPSRSD